MASLKDNVASQLSELRNMVLGAQILLGFQYEALFMPRFEMAASENASFYLAGFALLNFCLLIIIAPVAHHHLAARGEATQSQSRFASGALCLGALTFAFGLGANVAFATGVIVSNVWWIALSATGAALLVWFGVELMMRKPQSDRPQSEAISVKEKISELMSESRIVLPGVQALLGFQLAAYLSDGFPKLSSMAQDAHGVGLVLLLASMILLMAPAPFHRIADHGESTMRTEKIGAGMIVGALAFLGLALSADVFVAVSAVLHNDKLAAVSAGLAAVAGLVLWFVYPLAKGAGTRDARLDQTAAQS